MSNIIESAIIGCGNWGKNHARVYHELEKSSLNTVCDIDINKASYIAMRYGANFCIDSNIVFKSSIINAVSICTPTITHFQLAKQALESGKHVLVEKPMTHCVEKAIELLQCADEEGLLLSVGFVERFNPALTKAIELVKKGEIGEVIYISSRRFGKKPKQVSDVGVIKDLAIHDIDITNQFFLMDPTQIYAKADCITQKFVDYAKILISYPERKNAFIEVNWLSPKKIREYIITGTKGVLFINFLKQEVILMKDGELQKLSIINNEPLRLELSDFVNSIISKKKLTVTGLDGLKALVLCEKALESIITNNVIKNPIQNLPPV